ncbi:hypothetical protein GV794_25205 [Nocardia cyriacigeorgica]|uniref:Low molecular weight antigen MTB12-like C-terminal domain-containing protein n=1 Tax=Nocardia cyriacigeorgica TaxID=135487 RepID=A0ABX0CUL9_9NOCA|nr:hypothetical protein [Nocardia cyriacigeorgica]NEW58912.1 hypothetical protein [Nocardia cyriacigeorgica]
MLLPVRALRFSVAAAAAVALSLGMTACGSDDDSSDSAATSATTSAAAAASATGSEHGDHGTDAAPTPETLQAVLDKLASPDVPTAEKTQLIVNGEQRTANIDQMNAALAGYGTLTFGVTDVTTEGTTATGQVVITSPHGAAPAMPLTWENVDGTWKLSDASGCLLLGFAQAPCVPA